MSKPHVTAKEQIGTELPEPLTSINTLWQPGTAEWISRKLWTGGQDSLGPSFQISRFVRAWGKEITEIY